MADETNELHDELREIHGMLDILYNEVRPLWDKLHVIEELQLTCLTRMSRIETRLSRREGGHE